MVKSIIATDMAFHGPMIEQFKNTHETLDPENPKDKEFMMGFLLHGSD